LGISPPFIGGQYVLIKASTHSLSFLDRLIDNVFSKKIYQYKIGVANSLNKKVHVALRGYEP